MLRYIYANDLKAYPKLHDTMFADRAYQFHNRLGWDVSINTAGEERDEYDALNPLYVIWEAQNGCHGGSMRFLATTGRNMAADHFSYLTGGNPVSDPRIWECTRFCLGKDASPRVSARLMLGGAELGLAFNLSHALGVFDARMVRIYRRLGWLPKVLGTQGTGQDSISIGLWEYNHFVRNNLLRKAGISDELSRHWFQRAFGREMAMVASG